MAEKGAFTFVLHSHIPYVRQAGRWPHGEEWIHEAAVETYIPLIDQLCALRDAGIRNAVTLGLTPILLEQLADEDIRRNLKTYLEVKIAAAESDIERFESKQELKLVDLARFYLREYQSVQESYLQRYEMNLVPVLKSLQDDGVIEIITCAATHGYLPLLDRDESIHLQLHTAVHAYERHFERKPQAIWLPECAYRPGYLADDGRTRPGLETFLAEYGLKLFFSETHLVEGGRPVGMAAGEVIGPYGAVTRRYLVPFQENETLEPGSTFYPYYVYTPDVTVIGRNNPSGLQVWSADWGYPGDYDYREFHKKDGISGLQYWRVTGTKVDLGEKELYNPDWAQNKVSQHCDHFTWLVTQEIQNHHQASQEFGLVAANFDTELFGHWWMEGVDWLTGVIKRMADSPTVQLTTASRYVGEHPPQTIMQLPEGSWGAGGTHFVWKNVDTEWMWPLIHAAERRMLTAVQSAAESQPTAAEEQRLNQAGRELLLLQSSDWPFLVTTGQAREYATERFRQHLERFDVLLDGAVPADQVQQIWEADRIFPEIDYRWYAA